ncbi:Hypothetical_protein [Hexamita inflata]|uniref:Hypothetical_protein n=1 Tax=Hexamita inflata TaxID=28002 RepID=A0AA86NPK2_9EUKA|nr:Hypothetical protein HINF_LOCUS10463 [Hexamita inflata]
MNLQRIDYYFNVDQVDKLCYNIRYATNFKRTVDYSYLFIPEGYMNNICRFNNQIYIVLFDFIFTLSEMNLQFLCEIPGYATFAQEWHHACNQTWLFQFNSKLYVYNNSLELFELDGNTLTCVKREFGGYVFFSFYDKLFCLKNNTQLFRVIQSTDFQLEFIMRTEYVRVMFNSSGVVVLQANEAIIDHKAVDQFTIYVLNLLDDKIVTLLPNTDFCFIEKQISLGLNGYVLESEYLLGQFGFDFNNRVGAYQRQQLSQNECQFKNFVFNSKLEHLMRFEETNVAIQQIANQIKTDSERVRKLIEGSIQQQNLMASKFEELVNEIEWQ